MATKLTRGNGSNLADMTALMASHWGPTQAGTSGRTAWEGPGGRWNGGKVEVKQTARL